MLNVDDAANAIVKTIEHYQNGIGHTLNVCDDEPVLYQDLINFIAERLEAAKPRHIPVWLAKLLLGSTSVNTLLASIRCKNQAFKEKIGWQPQYPTFRQGIAAEVERWLHRNTEK